MNQTVNIPFSIRLGPEDTAFNITVDNKFLDNPNRQFGFATVTLTPDYYSQQAFKLDLDSTDELKAPVTEEFSLETLYDESAFDVKPYPPSSVSQTVGSLLKNVNAHFERHKPEACIYPLAVFDWIHVSALSAQNAEEFYQSKVDDLYLEKQDENTGQFLPDVFKGKFNLNNRAFPTNPNILRLIRTRLTLAPNVTIAFSNTNLPLAFGFSPQQLRHSFKTQIRLTNNSHVEFKTLICQNAPSSEKSIYSTKIHLYPSFKFVVLNKQLVTTKERERKVVNMASDYGEIFKKSANLLNLKLSLELDATQKKFKFIFPEGTKIKMSIKMPPFIAYKLGYGHVNSITLDSVNLPYPEESEISNVDSIAKVLVYDTGMVVVSLDQLGSQQTHQFTNTVMAILESDPAGIMTTKPGLEFARVAVSPFNPTMEFVLYKYNENNQPIPLGWKVGSYVRGLLVGKL